MLQDIEVCVSRMVLHKLAEQLGCSHSEVRRELREDPDRVRDALTLVGGKLPCFVRGYLRDWVKDKLTQRRTHD